MKLNIKKLSIAIGLTWGLYVLALGWLAASSIDWGDPLVSAFSSLYRGYDTTFWGSIIGGIWGFVDGAVFGALAAYFYNTVNK
ncbi:MAG TPA: bacteriophage holin [Candidatus Saccharimonadales bacterium]|nr:bacteriophage holin [Candidatus Saccharimonadales bacterium]